MQKEMVYQNSMNPSAMSYLAGLQSQKTIGGQYVHPGVKEYIQHYGSEQMKMLFGQTTPFPNKNTASIIERTLPSKESVNKESNNVPTSGQNKNGQKTSTDDTKLFKRSSYHVAIAYHIYFKQLENS